MSFKRLNARNVLTSLEKMFQSFAAGRWNGFVPGASDVIEAYKRYFYSECYSQECLLQLLNQL